MGLSFTRKEVIRKQHPLYGQERIEVHHIQPKFRGGSDDRQNLEPLLLDDHALQHLYEAENSESRDIAKVHYWATSQIIRRMNSTEKERLKGKLKHHK